MKDKRALIMLGVAILFGIAAVLLASQWLLGKKEAKAARVVVVTADINRGQRLTADMLTLAERAQGEVPKDAFKDPAVLADRVLKTNVSRGEILAESKLAPAGTMGGLSALISEGKRAITVRVNDVIGVAGFALPGNYVDIIVHTERDPAENDKTANSGRHVSKIVLERILVLAVAQEVSRDETKPKVVNAVTLEVTPEQAEHLDLARGVGTLSLALRNQIDPTLPDTSGATKRSLLNEAAPVMAAVAKKPAPAKRPAARLRTPVVQTVAQAPRDCVSVLNGLHASKECF
jgi:pilus assembly protein CpaB